MENQVINCFFWHQYTAAKQYLLLISGSCPWNKWHIRCILARSWCWYLYQMAKQGIHASWRLWRVQQDRHDGFCKMKNYFAFFSILSFARSWLDPTVCLSLSGSKSIWFSKTLYQTCHFAHLIDFWRGISFGQPDLFCSRQPMSTNVEHLFSPQKLAHHLLLGQLMLTHG